LTKSPWLHDKIKRETGKIKKDFSHGENLNFIVHAHLKPIAGNWRKKISTRKRIFKTAKLKFSLHAYGTSNPSPDEGASSSANASLSSPFPPPPPTIRWCGVVVSFSESINESRFSLPASRSPNLQKKNGNQSMNHIMLITRQLCNLLASIFLGSQPTVACSIMVLKRKGNLAKQVLPPSRDSFN
jgi:hypothetical protein